MSTSIERYLLIGASLALLVTLLADIAARRRGRPQWPLALAGMALSATSVFALLAGRWLRESQGPFLTLYDVLVSNVFSLALVYLIAAQLLPDLRRGSAAVTSFLLLLCVWALQVPADAIRLPATFDNPWLWMHVATGKVFLGLCMTAAAMAGLLLITEGGRGDDTPRSSMPPSDGPLWLVMSLAFLCHSSMLIAGAVWAHSAWGRYWAWDSLETWTFVTWLAMAALLHAHISYRRMPAMVSRSAIVGIFMLAILTFLGVPFVSIAPHKGVM